MKIFKISILDKILPIFYKILIFDSVILAIYLIWFRHPLCLIIVTLLSFIWFIMTLNYIFSLIEIQYNNDLILIKRVLTRKELVYKIDELWMVSYCKGSFKAPSGELHLISLDNTIHKYKLGDFKIGEEIEADIREIKKIKSEKNWFSQYE